MKQAVFDQQGKKVKEIELNDAVFDAKANDKVLSQYIYVYLQNQRQANAHTKTKSEVRGGGRKPWNQKGTGRARAGTSRSPLWRGGGIVFGPRNLVNYARKTTKSFRKAALRTVLSKLNKEEQITFVSQIKFDSEKPLTKQAVDLVTSFGNPRKLTIVTNEMNEDLLKAFSNLEKHSVKQVKDVNVYDLLNGGKILLEEETLTTINLRAQKQYDN